MDDNINTALCRDFTSGSEVVVNNLTDFNGHGTTRDVIEGRLNAEKAVKNALLHTVIQMKTLQNINVHVDILLQKIMNGI